MGNIWKAFHPWSETRVQDFKTTIDNLIRENKLTKATTTGILKGKLLWKTLKDSPGDVRTTIELYLALIKQVIEFSAGDQNTNKKQKIMNSLLGRGGYELNRKCQVKQYQTAKN